MKNFMWKVTQYCFVNLALVWPVLFIALFIDFFYDFEINLFEWWFLFVIICLWALVVQWAAIKVINPDLIQKIKNYFL